MSPTEVRDLFLGGQTSMVITLDSMLREEEDIIPSELVRIASMAKDIGSSTTLSLSPVSSLTLSLSIFLALLLVAEMGCGTTTRTDSA